MKMIDEKSKDLDGRKHKLYIVRSMGAGQGFGSPKLQAAIDQVKKMAVFNGCIFQAAEAAPILLMNGKNDRYTVLIHGGKFAGKFVADKNPL